jgi:hypothetical protein
VNPDARAAAEHTMRMIDANRGRMKITVINRRGAFAGLRGLRDERSAQLERHMSS